MPPGCPHLREGLGQNQCAYCCQEGHRKNECPQQAKNSQKDPQTRGRGQIVEGNYQPTHREAGPWEENIVGLAGLEGYKEA
jgi:hypothetical protein